MSTRYLALSSGDFSDISILRCLIMATTSLCGISRVASFLVFSFSMLT